MSNQVSREYKNFRCTSPSISKISIDGAAEIQLNAEYRIHLPKNQKPTDKGVRAERAPIPFGIFTQSESS